MAGYEWVAAINFNTRFFGTDNQIASDSYFDLKFINGNDSSDVIINKNFRDTVYGPQTIYLFGDEENPVKFKGNKNEAQMNFPSDLVFEFSGKFDFFSEINERLYITTGYAISLSSDSHSEVLFKKIIKDKSQVRYISQSNGGLKKNKWYCLDTNNHHS